MDLIIVSGLSGSGKSIALHALEDLGYYCVDNLPAALLPQLAEELKQQSGGSFSQTALSIDSRNREFLQALDQSLKRLRNTGLAVRIVFLESSDQSLVQRYKETRRRHPLTDNSTSLPEGIAEERQLLAPLARQADRTINTSVTTPHELRAIIRNFASGHLQRGPMLTLQSFGFKHGAPADADFVFDLRCLPNPYWENHLRDLSGLDQPVMDFLERSGTAQEMVRQVGTFLAHWLPHFETENRSYLTIAFGCTGGQHRSVYLVQKMAAKFEDHDLPVQIRHRDLRPVARAQNS